MLLPPDSVIGTIPPLVTRFLPDRLSAAVRRRLVRPFSLCIVRRFAAGYWCCVSTFREIFAMLQPRPGPWFIAVLLLLLSGCADNSMVLKGKVGQYEQEKVALTRQNQELLARASKLDQDNQELGKTVAQWQQQSKVFEDQLAALRDQLRSVNTQLAQAKAEKETTEKKVQTLTASMQRQGGVSITPNNSFLQTLPVINLPGSLRPPRRRRDPRGLSGQPALRVGQQPAEAGRGRT